MIGYLLFGLTFLTYILIGVYALQFNPGGDQFGNAYSSFVLLSAYVGCSLLLSINIFLNGGFNWISDNSWIRIAVVTLLWLGMVTVAFCTMERTEFHKYYQLTGFVRLLSLVFSYAAIWLPLLILIPYFIFLKAESRDSFSPILVSIPLVLGCVLGFFLLLTPRIMADVLSKSFKKFDEHELAYNAAMANIEKYDAVISLLYYSGDTYDKQISSAAYAKIKAIKNWEDDLIDILERGNPYGVFDFLEENKVEHPDRFIEPIVNSFALLTTDMHEGIVSSYQGGAFDVGPLLSVLEGQFKDHIAVFKPHIIKLQEAMEATPAKSRVYHDVEKCDEALYKYREEVKNWLARH